MLSPSPSRSSWLGLRPWFLRCLVLGLAAAACSPAVRPPSVLSPWHDEQARYFDDGIDFETNRVVRLRGKWSTSDDELFQNRLGHADAVAVGRIQLITAESRGEQVRGYRVAFTVDEVLKGDFGGFTDEKNLSLGVALASDGRKVLEDRARELTGSKAVLYLKWQNAKDRQYRFHLSDAVARPPEELRAMLKLRAR